MKTLLIVCALVLAGCDGWSRRSQDERDVIEWHNLHRQVSEINTRWVKKCKAKGQTFGLDAIGDIACLDQPVAPPPQK